MLILEFTSCLIFFFQAKLFEKSYYTGNCEYLRRRCCSNGWMCYPPWSWFREHSHIVKKRKNQLFTEPKFGYPIKLPPTDHNRYSPLLFPNLWFFWPFLNPSGVTPNKVSTSGGDLITITGRSFGFYQFAGLNYGDTKLQIIRDLTYTPTRFIVHRCRTTHISSFNRFCF